MMRESEESSPPGENSLILRYYEQNKIKQDQDRRPELESYVKNELKEEMSVNSAKSPKKVDVGERLYAIGKLYE